MKLVEQINQWLIEWGMTSLVADVLDQYVAFAGVLLLAYLAAAVCRKILLRVVARLVQRTKATWDDIVFDHKVMVRLSRIVAPLIITTLVPVAFSQTDSLTLNLILRVCEIYILLAFLNFLNSLLKAV